MAEQLGLFSSGQLSLPLAGGVVGRRGVLGAQQMSLPFGGASGGGGEQLGLNFRGPAIQMGTTGDARRAAKIRQQQGLPSSGQVFTGPGATGEPTGPTIYGSTTGDLRRAAKIRQQQQGLPSSGQVYTGPGPTDEPVGRRIIRENQQRKMERTMGSVPSGVRNGDPRAVMGGTMGRSGGGAAAGGMSGRGAGAWGGAYYRGLTNPIRGLAKRAGFNIGRGAAGAIGVGGLAAVGGLIGGLRGDVGGGVAGALGGGVMGLAVGSAAGAAWGAYGSLRKAGIGAKQGFSLLGKNTSIPAKTALGARVSAVRTAAKFGLIGAASAGLIGALLNSNRSY